MTAADLKVSGLLARNPAFADLLRPIDNDPVDPLSDQWIAVNQPTAKLHPDFGFIWNDAQAGIPFAVVGAGQVKVPVRATMYPEESDTGPMPIPPDVRIENGSDAHVCVYDSDADKLYELWQASTPDGGKSWSCSSSARFDLSATGGMRPAEWTSADAAGLPILPLLARPGETGCAVRMTVPHTNPGWVHPARHGAADVSTACPMGARLRLKPASLERERANLTGHALILAERLRKYGGVIADNGSPWYVTGEATDQWDGSTEQLKRFTGADFEFVKAAPGLKITGPTTLRPGETGEFTLTLLPAGDVQPTLGYSLYDQGGTGPNVGVFGTGSNWLNVKETSAKFTWKAPATSGVYPLIASGFTGRYGGSAVASEPNRSTDGLRSPAQLLVTVAGTPVVNPPVVNPPVVKPPVVTPPVVPAGSPFTVTVFPAATPIVAPAGSVLISPPTPKT